MRWNPTALAGGQTQCRRREQAGHAFARDGDAIWNGKQARRGLYKTGHGPDLDRRGVFHRAAGPRAYTAQQAARRRRASDGCRQRSRRPRSHKTIRSKSIKLVIPRSPARSLPDTKINPHCRHEPLYKARHNNRGDSAHDEGIARCNNDHVGHADRHGASPRIHHALRPDGCGHGTRLSGAYRIPQPDAPCQSARAAWAPLSGGHPDRAGACAARPGDGLHAVFQLESGLTAATAGARARRPPVRPPGHRRLLNARWGELRLGRQYNAATRYFLDMLGPAFGGFSLLHTGYGLGMSSASFRAMTTRSSTKRVDGRHQGRRRIRLQRQRHA